MNPLTSPLLTDLYHLNMIQAYLDHGETKTAVFEFFVRKFPPRRGFLIAAGLEQALDFLENLRFSPEEIDWLAGTRRFDRTLLDQLATFRFTGDVHAMPEGRVFFAHEPILRVTAPMPQAQLVETRLINILHFQTLIAAKAARMVLAAPGKLLVDFGLRRAHGAEAGLMAARASYIAGFAGTATTLASHYRGRELNSPNDLVVKSDGSVYFTDPLYGRRAGYGVERPPELGFCGVYRIKPGVGELVLLADDFPAPNGLCFSPDESLLYVNDTHVMHTRVFDVLPDGTLADGRLFFDEAAHGARWEEGDPDGIKVDERGNVFCTGPGGVWVISPEGEWLGLIEVPEIVANLTWGGPGWSALYICATRSLYRVQTRTRGNRVPHMSGA